MHKFYTLFLVQSWFLEQRDVDVSRPNVPSALHSCDTHTVISQLWRHQPMWALVDDRRQLVHDSVTDRKPVKFTQ